MLYVFLVIFIKWFLIILFRPAVYGSRANLKPKGGVIFIANHISLMDPVMLAVVSPRLIHFMAKKELFESKIGKAIFKGLLVFPVNRRSADIKSLKQAIKLLDEGKAFGIFPEGRRSVTGEMDEFEKGTAFIAAKCDAPIVPVYIDPKSYTGARRLKVIVGEKIYAKELAGRCDKRRLVDALTAKMQAEMRSLKRRMDELNEKKHGSKKR